MEDVKEWTCSLGRANKLLAQLREGSSQKNKRSSSRYAVEPRNTYSMQLSLLSNVDSLSSCLAAMTERVKQDLLIRRLADRWKNKLFEVNVLSGVSSILSELDTLSYEKSLLESILASLNEYQSLTLEEAQKVMDSVGRAALPPSAAWNVTAFRKDEITGRLAQIRRLVSTLDEAKDKLNAETKFTIVLTEAERSLLNL